MGAIASIDEIIQREVNPFDPATFKPGNFWQEKQNAALTVNSIHQEAIAEIETLLDRVAQDHRSRTVLLTGDSGSGKSYLLGRLKRTLNPKAFFAYIGPWADGDHIRRHILRYTVDSLTQIPEGQQESQLMLWLKGLSAFTKRSVKQRIFDDSVWELLRSDRQKFIKHLKTTYQKTGIYNADSFFGVLHDLTDPELSTLACEWLRGDDLSEESLKELKVKHSIESEDAAWEILANLGRISTATQPIVLCFDQLEDPMQTDPQPFFNINTTIHNQALKNFLVVISLTTNTWRQVINRLQMSDKAGIHQENHLKRISLEQAEALWAFRLQTLHSQADSPPDSPIFPLTRQALEVKFPGGKTDPRNTLELGRIEYQRYKDSLVLTQSKPIQPPPPPPQPTPTPAPAPAPAKAPQPAPAPAPAAAKAPAPAPAAAKAPVPAPAPAPAPAAPPVDAAFKLLWQDELKKAQGRYTKLTQLSSPELIRMLQDALAALAVKEIKPKLIGGKFTSSSFSYQKVGGKEQMGVVWTEDSNMNSFYTVMKACEGAIEKKACHTLIFIRAGAVGNAKLASYQIYRKIFKNDPHRHVKPTLTSVQYLGAYHSLVNSALADELVISGEVIKRKRLEELVRQTEILSKCPLLQELEIVSKPSTEASPVLDVKDFLLNLAKTQGYLGKITLIDNAIRQFPEVNQAQVEQQIQELIQAKKLKIANPDHPPTKHLICFVP